MSVPLSLKGKTVIGTGGGGAIDLMSLFHATHAAALVMTSGGRGGAMIASARFKPYARRRYSLSMRSGSLPGKLIGCSTGRWSSAHLRRNHDDAG